jgi:hypothetical protein
MELIATPARTIAVGVVPLRREIARMSTVVSIPPAKAHSVTM